MATEKTFRAVTEVHITEAPGKNGDRMKGIAPIPPKVVVVPAKGLLIMDPDSDTAQELLAKGAIVPAPDAGKEVAPTKIGQTKPALAKKTAPKAKEPAAAKPAKAATKGDDAGSEDGSDVL